jgi:hypothetical protein
MIRNSLQNQISEIENEYQYSNKNENEKVLILMQIILNFFEFLAYTTINFSDFYEKFETLTFMSKYYLFNFY